MKRMYSIVSLSLFAGLSFASSSSKQQKELRGLEANALVKQSNHIIINAPSKVPSFVEFVAVSSKEKAIDLLKPSFAFRNDDEFKLLKNEKDNVGGVHYQYNQYYKGVKVEDGIYTVHTKSNTVLSANGFFVDNIVLNTQVVLSPQQAIDAALKSIGAKRYKWQVPEEEALLKSSSKNNNASYYPQPELTITAAKADYFKREMYLTYKFDVYADEPMTREFVYVDAHSGKIIRRDNRICEANAGATGNTRYSGNQPFMTDNFGANQYRLRETGRGNGIETYNMLKGTNYGAAVDFTNNSINWNGLNNANKDDAALDAHWGAEGTWDYYSIIHSRNSYDNAGAAIKSYVHYGVNYNNAFWNGTNMTYGDGSNSPGAFTPLTAIDVCGHEITHGVTSYEANLQYSYESGALNESFSDIFGTTIEFYKKPNTANFLIGEQIMFGGVGALRSMSNPNAHGDPDTYLGTNWYAGAGDNGGVHTNSGVQNYWYYLVCQGGVGTNDLGNSFNVTASGMAKAADITYRSLSIYLTTTSQYIDARTYSIQAARDLYGMCSQEEITVTNAWYACGVGPAYTVVIDSDFSGDVTSACSLPATVNFTNMSVNLNNYTWDFGDGNTSNAANPSHTYTSAGNYTVKLNSTGACGLDSMIKTAYISIVLPASVTAVNGSRCDSGSVSLSATGGVTTNWYTAQQGGSPIYIGANYNTPTLVNTTTYYVENEVPATPLYVGPIDNTIGGGGNSNTGTTHYLIFNVYQPIVLNSVWVNASTAGQRTINLWDNAGNVIQTLTVNIPSGMSRVNLNLPLATGTGYRLGGTNMNLYRNNGGVTYPYTQNGMVSITGSDAGSGFYYFFYNWEIQAASCRSLRVPVTATIYTPPTALITAQGSTTFCVGDSVILDAGQASGYLWTPGGQTTQTITVYNPGNYSVMITDGNGCSSTSLEEVITVNPLPVVSLANLNPLCSNALAITLAGGNPAGGTYSGVGVTNGTFDPAVAGAGTHTITYSFSDQNGCTNTASQSILVNQAPNVTLTLADDTVCAGNATTSLTGGMPANGTYSGTGVNENNFNPILAGLGSHVITYIFMNAAGCSDTATQTINVVECVGVNELANNNNLSVYPNPAKDMFTITYVAKGTSDITVKLYNAAGEIVFNETKKQVSGEYKKSIDLSGKSTGVYYLQLVSDKETVVRKVVKQ